MWAEFRSSGRDVPLLTSFDVADLYTWFYATLYFSPSGDQNRGAAVFREKNCVNCHSAVLDTRAANPAAERWTGLGPVTWAERMWNHAGDMDSAVANRGLAWPSLSEQDIADLMMFVRSLRPAGDPVPGFEIGEAEQGRAVFEQSCETCHSFGETLPGRTRVDLLSRPAPSSVVGYIAMMWNHAPQMRKSGGSVAALKAGEMPDLVAFLFSQRYFLDRGDASRGRSVFAAKGCATCHETRRQEMKAPDLAQLTEVYSPITLTSAVWRHGPSMLNTMGQMGMSWPEFQRSEMTDLIAYLNSRLILRIGPQASH
jgi:cytochrome c2